MGYGKLYFVSDITNLKSAVDRADEGRFVNDLAEYKRELLAEVGIEIRKPKTRVVRTPLPGRERAPIGVNPFSDFTREQGEYRKELQQTRARALALKEQARLERTKRKADAQLAKLEREEKKLAENEQKVVSEYADKVDYSLSRLENLENDTKNVGATVRVRRLIMERSVKPTFKQNPACKLVDVLVGEKLEAAIVAAQCHKCETVFARLWVSWTALAGCPKCTRTDPERAKKIAMARSSHTKARTALWVVQQLGGDK